ncbi:hypothetical protein BGZ83_006072 [Gryganskiella cystojenkinii]|nr:hypothetical protein BGZ83_006072 [Gryganskiella cystojenkinii]
MSHHHDDDEDFGNNTGYKVGQKKSLAEYNSLDAGDESLNRWKASLGVAKVDVSKLDDPHNVVVLQLCLEVAGRPDVVLDLTQSEEALKQHSFTIKEGVEYRLKVLFKVQHEVVSGLKYRHVIKRGPITVDKTEEMIGSYAAQVAPIEKKASFEELKDADSKKAYLRKQKFATEEAPSGMMARGHYEARSKFVDDDGTVHKAWNWSFDIKKDW